MADIKPYKLSMSGAEANAGIETGMEVGKTAGILYGDGNGGVTAATPGTDFGYPLIRGNGAPLANTAANLGQMYFDMTARREPYMYVCVGYNSYGFVWCVLGGEVIDNSEGGDNSTINSGAVPPHGAAGQVLKKKSGEDYDVEWGEILKALELTLSASKWVDNQQTVSAEGVTADNSVIAAAAPSSRVPYGEFGVYCITQEEGILTFACESPPNLDITVNVLSFM